MENKGLLFIPDISGFTRFVNESDIEHSRLIIQELLELLINANEIGLEVSEIEGDAILFYKFGSSPNLKDLYSQVERMFFDFHRHLNNYERGRFCQCQACASAIQLTLKVITHYGEFTGYNVKNFSKLIGRDVIVAHQLLKNDIEQHEYWLVTNNLFPDQAPVDLAQWMNWESSVKKTENGEIPFHYAQLGPLKANIPPEPAVLLDLSKKRKVFSISKEFDTDILTLFHASGDLRYRSKWMTGVEDIEGLEFILPRVGMRFRRVLANGQTSTYTSSCAYHPDRVEFSETDEKDNHTIYFTLVKKDANHSLLTIDVYHPKTLLPPIFFQLQKKKQMQEEYQQSMKNLVQLVKDIRY